MSPLIRLLILSGVTVMSGCVVVGGAGPAVGFYGPFPAIYVPGHTGDGRRGYDRDHRERVYRDDNEQGDRQEHRHQRHDDRD
jgi:hypothetical protein